MVISLIGMGIIEVLLIEDNHDEATLITEILRSYVHNINITCINDGMDAMGYLYKINNYKNSKRPSLIILDLNLPRKDGREILEEIKTDNKLKSIPVVVLRSSDNDKDIIESYEHYANAYIIKSADFDKFNNDIRGFVDFWFNSVMLPNFNYSE